MSSPAGPTATNVIAWIAPILSFGVEIDVGRFREIVEGILDDVGSAGHDQLAGSDHGACLLTAEHDTGSKRTKFMRYNNGVAWRIDPTDP
jgi:hypothetical protein